MTGLSETPNPVRVLVVDDFHSMTDALVAMLSGCGHDARAAYDGAEALRIAADFQLHAIISDVRMPVMNGFELAQEVVSEFDRSRLLLNRLKVLKAALQRVEGLKRKAARARRRTS